MENRGAPAATAAAVDAFVSRLLAESRGAHLRAASSATQHAARSLRYTSLQAVLGAVSEEFQLDRLSEFPCNAGNGSVPRLVAGLPLWPLRTCPSLAAFAALESRITIRIFAAIATRPVVTAYDLEGEVCAAEGVSQWAELSLGVNILCMEVAQRCFRRNAFSGGGGGGFGNPQHALAVPAVTGTEFVTFLCRDAEAATLVAAGADAQALADAFAARAPHRLHRGSHCAIHIGSLHWLVSLVASERARAKAAAASIVGLATLQRSSRSATFAAAIEAVDARLESTPRGDSTSVPRVAMVAFECASLSSATTFRLVDGAGTPWPMIPAPDVPPIHAPPGTNAVGPPVAAVADVRSAEHLRYGEPSVLRSTAVQLAPRRAAPPPVLGVAPPPVSATATAVPATVVAKAEESPTGEPATATARRSDFNESPIVAALHRLRNHARDYERHQPSATRLVPLAECLTHAQLWAALAVAVAATTGCHELRLGRFTSKDEFTTAAPASTHGAGEEQRGFVAHQLDLLPVLLCPTVKDVECANVGATGAQFPGLLVNAFDACECACSLSPDHIAPMEICPATLFDDGAATDAAHNCDQGQLASSRRALVASICQLASVAAPGGGTDVPADPPRAADAAPRSLPFYFLHPAYAVGVAALHNTNPAAAAAMSTMLYAACRSSSRSERDISDAAQMVLPTVKADAWNSLMEMSHWSMAAATARWLAAVDAQVERRQPAAGTVPLSGRAVAARHVVASSSERYWGLPGGEGVTAAVREHSSRTPLDHAAGSLPSLLQDTASALLNFVVGLVSLPRCVVTARVEAREVVSAERGAAMLDCIVSAASLPRCRVALEALRTVRWLPTCPPSSRDHPGATQRSARSARAERVLVAPSVAVVAVDPIMEALCGFITAAEGRSWVANVGLPPQAFVSLPSEEGSHLTQVWLSVLSLLGVHTELTPRLARQVLCWAAGGGGGRVGASEAQGATPSAGSAVPVVRRIDRRLILALYTVLEADGAGSSGVVEFSCPSVFVPLPRLAVSRSSNVHPLPQLGSVDAGFGDVSAESVDVVVEGFFEYPADACWELPVSMDTRLLSLPPNAIPEHIASSLGSPLCLAYPVALRHFFVSRLGVPAVLSTPRGWAAAMARLAATCGCARGEEGLLPPTAKLPRNTAGGPVERGTGTASRGHAEAVLVSALSLGLREFSENLLRAVWQRELENGGGDACETATNGAPSGGAGDSALLLTEVVMRTVLPPEHPGGSWRRIADGIIVGGDTARQLHRAATSGSLSTWGSGGSANAASLLDIAAASWPLLGPAVPAFLRWLGRRCGFLLAETVVHTEVLFRAVDVAGTALAHTAAGAAALAVQRMLAQRHPSFYESMQPARVAARLARLQVLVCSTPEALLSVTTPPRSLRLAEPSLSRPPIVVRLPITALFVPCGGRGDLTSTGDVVCDDIGDDRSFNGAAIYADRSAAETGSLANALVDAVMAPAANDAEPRGDALAVAKATMRRTLEASNAGVVVVTDGDHAIRKSDHRDEASVLAAALAVRELWKLPLAPAERFRSVFPPGTDPVTSNGLLTGPLGGPHHQNAASSVTNNTQLQMIRALAARTAPLHRGTVDASEVSLGTATRNDATPLQGSPLGARSVVAVSTEDTRSQGLEPGKRRRGAYVSPASPAAALTAHTTASEERSPDQGLPSRRRRLEDASHATATLAPALAGAGAGSAMYSEDRAVGSLGYALAAERFVAESLRAALAGGGSSGGGTVDGRSASAALLQMNFSPGERGEVAWVNEGGESGLPYDVVVTAVSRATGTRRVAALVEVKATRGRTREAFELSLREFAAAVLHGARFRVARVYDAGALEPVVGGGEAGDQGRDGPHGLRRPRIEWIVDPVARWQSGSLSMTGSIRTLSVGGGAEHPER